MPHGVHSKDQLNVRLPPDLLARLKDGSKRHGHTVTDIVTRGTAAELDRLDGIATEPEPVSPPRARSREAPAPAAVPVAADPEQPQAAGKRKSAPRAGREPESASDIMAALRRRRSGES